MSTVNGLTPNWWMKKIAVARAFLQVWGVRLSQDQHVRHSTQRRFHTAISTIV
jgi:hypothetical protein